MSKKIVSCLKKIVLCSMCFTTLLAPISWQQVHASVSKNYKSILSNKKKIKKGEKSFGAMSSYTVDGRYLDINKERKESTKHDIKEDDSSFDFFEKNNYTVLKAQTNDQSTDENDKPITTYLCYNEKTKKFDLIAICPTYWEVKKMLGKQDYKFKTMKFKASVDNGKTWKSAKELETYRYERSYYVQIIEDLNLGNSTRIDSKVTLTWEANDGTTTSTLDNFIALDNKFWSDGSSFKSAINRLKDGSVICQNYKYYFDRPISLWVNRNKKEILVECPQYYSESEKKLEFVLEACQIDIWDAVTESCKEFKNVNWIKNPDEEKATGKEGYIHPKYSRYRFTNLNLTYVDGISAYVYLSWHYPDTDKKISEKSIIYSGGKTNSKESTFYVCRIPVRGDKLNYCKSYYKDEASGDEFELVHDRYEGILHAKLACPKGKKSLFELSSNGTDYVKIENGQSNWKISSDWKDEDKQRNTDTYSSVWFKKDTSDVLAKFYSTEQSNNKIIVLQSMVNFVDDGFRTHTKKQLGTLKWEFTDIGNNQIEASYTEGSTTKKVTVASSAKEAVINGYKCPINKEWINKKENSMVKIIVTCPSDDKKYLIKECTLLKNGNEEIETYKKDTGSNKLTFSKLPLSKGDTVTVKARITWKNSNGKEESFIHTSQHVID